MGNHGNAKSNPSLPHLGVYMCVIQTLKWPLEHNQFKMLQGEGVHTMHLKFPKFTGAIIAFSDISHTKNPVSHKKLSIPRRSLCVMCERGEEWDAHQHIKNIQINDSAICCWQFWVSPCSAALSQIHRYLHAVLSSAQPKYLTESTHCWIATKQLNKSGTVVNQPCNSFSI